MRPSTPLPTRALLGLVPLVLLGGLLIACGGGDSPELSAPIPSPALQAGADPRQPLLPEGVEPIQFDALPAALETVDGRSFTLDLEIADTFARRTRGLMHRLALGPLAGMLFAFPEETAGPFWNRDTPLDLDIAFLDAEGRLIQLLPLEGSSTELIAPDLPYLYALEMERGWFASNGVGPNDRLLIPPGVEGLPE